MTHQLPAPVARAVDGWLAGVDRALPGFVTGLYVVGSTALGAWREGRSDVDVVALVDGDVGPVELRSLRRQHWRSGLRTGVAALRRGRSPLSGTLNGLLVRRKDLGRPVGQIEAVAAMIGHELHVGWAGSDLSPVGWKTLAELGIPVRGAPPSTLGLDPEPERLVAWNLQNLDEYWRPWAATTAVAGPRFRLQARYATAWGVLGPPRLHRTIATGEIVSKEAAGEYALEAFDRRWHPLVEEALAYWRRQPDQMRMPVAERRRLVADFVVEVADDARRIGSGGAEIDR